MECSMRPECRSVSPVRSCSKPASVLSINLNLLPSCCQINSNQQNPALFHSSLGENSDQQEVYFSHTLYKGLVWIIPEPGPVRLNLHVLLCRSSQPACLFILFPHCFFWFFFEEPLWVMWCIRMKAISYLLDLLDLLLRKLTSVCMLFGFHSFSWNSRCTSRFMTDNSEKNFLRQDVEETLRETRPRCVDLFKTSPS